MLVEKHDVHNACEITLCKHMGSFGLQLLILVILWFCYHHHIRTLFLFTLFLLSCVLNADMPVIQELNKKEVTVGSLSTREPRSCSAFLVTSQVCPSHCGNCRNTTWPVLGMAPQFCFLVLH